MSDKTRFSWVEQKILFQRLPRVASALVILGWCSLGLMVAPACRAGWFGKKFIKQPEPAVTVPQQNLASTIRRWKHDAQQAAERGDLATARQLAQRAHKLALTCRPMLTDAPDCAPEQLALLVLMYTPSNPAPTQPQPVPPTKSQHQMELAHMVDVPTTVSSPLVPPSPAPTTLPVSPVKPSKQNPAQARTDIAASPAVPQPTITQTPRANAPLTVAGQKPASTTAKLREPAASSRLPQLKASTPNQRTQPSVVRQLHNPSESQSFLVLRSDWLSEDTDVEELIEELDEEPEAPVLVRRSQPAPRKHLPNRQPAAELKAEVTTTISDESPADWALDHDLDDDDFDEEDADWDSPPVLPSQARQRESVSAVPLVSDAPAPVSPRTSSSIGIWTDGDATDNSPQPSRNVVSITEFFDPSTCVTPPMRTVVHSRYSDVPRMIETDFRSLTPAPTSAPEDLATAETKSADQPQARKSSRPTVSYRQDPALDWLPDDVAEPAPRPASSRWWQAVWQPSGKAHLAPYAAGGMMLVLCGMVLFCLSLRWS